MRNSAVLGIGVLALVILVACGGQSVSGKGIEGRASARSDDSSPEPSALPSRSTAAPVAGDGWQTYRNQQAGYSVSYPPTWTVDESTTADSTVTSVFRSAAGGAGITVSVHTGGPAQDESNDLPNQRCQPVTIGGVAGTRCLDTIARSTAITLARQGKTFVIRSAARALDPAIVERIVSSFRFSS